MGVAQRSSTFATAETLLKRMLGPEATFRPGQFEAIAAAVDGRERALIVQRTGWGKSVVYFLATAILRSRGAGPTLLVSPLLSLMRNQIAMAERIGVRAATINCDNKDDWADVEARLLAGGVDVLLISPERLANERFTATVLPAVRDRIGLFAVDEAHCISDWGHDFRPDYQRIVRVLRGLPPDVPVLATTATANDRVVEDIQEQLGQSLLVLRGPLARSSLRLQCLTLGDQRERLAWLATWLPKLPGSGIVYCLTKPDVERVAEWLQLQGIDAHAYHADLSTERKTRLEDELVGNRVKALVATVALGMGFDKPDLGFVIHYQRPSSVVAYYQQVGRAGRAVDRAYGILLSGEEDDEIADYFIRRAFPEPTVPRMILELLERADGLTLGKLAGMVNASPDDVERALRLLELAGVVARQDGKFIRAPGQWNADTQRMDRVSARRYAELRQMREYVAHEGCLMQFLARALDDPTAEPCGRCANCRKIGIPAAVDGALVAAASAFLRGAYFPIRPRQVWLRGLVARRARYIPPGERAQPGRALSMYGDAGWGRAVAQGKYVERRFSDDLVRAAADLMEAWQPSPTPTWVTAIPSLRHPDLVPDFAERLAAQFGLPFVVALQKAADTPEQKTMRSSLHQARNAAQGFGIAPGVEVPTGPVLLVDDIVDSRWTLTCAAALLRRAGSGPVFPFALAKTMNRDS